ncbi:MAG: hypothetical protein H6985_04655 [Pseudomonadales bacterium]|nr:hypothetical protein [Halioglobus sp.]MCP5128860.1 hypothetical protein [Pseudomonadales bacterium]
MLLILALLSLPGCSSSPPKDAFKLSESSLADRQLESRRLDTVDRKELLDASVGVLQDLGFSLDITNSELGILTASKELDAKNAGQIAAAAGLFTTSVLLAIVLQDISQLGSIPAVDDDQKVRVCLVINQSLENRDASVVRITISRVIWNTRGQITQAEVLKEPELYEAFFDKLSKATFLQAHNI